MKILQVLPTLSAGGAEGFVANLCIHLSRLEAEVELHLLSNKRDVRGKLLRERLQDEGVRISGESGASVRALSAPLNYLQAARRFAPNIVQSNLFSPEVYVALTRDLVAPDTKLVRRLANSRPEASTPRLVEWWVNKSFDLTIACSDTVRRFYDAKIASDAKGLAATIPNGARLRSAPPSAGERAAARRKFGLSKHNRVFGHIGRMTPVSKTDHRLESSQKGHDTLLRAFAHAFAGDGRKSLILVGDGSLKGRLLDLALSLGISSQVHFLGNQPEPWEALAAMDVFVFPSRFEGHPNVLPEAMASALPLVVSDIPENLDMLIGKAAAAVRVDDVAAFANAMMQFDRDFPLLAAKAGASAIDILEEKSMPRCAGAYLAAYESLLAR